MPNTTNMSVEQKDERKKDPADRQKSPKKFKRGRRKQEFSDEYEQRIIDIARVTRVMAGGKRMRFRACVAVGNRNGKIGVAVAKGADVTLAAGKAALKAKKLIINVPIIRDTIPHEISIKFKAAKLILKPAKAGRGVIAGGAVRIILELAGIKNVTSKILGTNNKISNVKCVIEALSRLKKPYKKEDSENKPAIEIKEQTPVEIK